MRAARLVALLFLCASVAKAGEPAPARLDETQRAFFKDYCVQCHNAKKQKGKLRLDDISFAIDSIENADRWQKILNKLNSGEMPPEDEQQPQRGRKTEFLDALSHTLVTARKIIGDQGGRITMRLPSSLEPREPLFHARSLGMLRKIIDDVRRRSFILGIPAKSR